MTLLEIKFNAVRALLIATIGTVIFAVVGFYVKAWVDTPTVVYSWSSKECKAIIYADGTRADCTGLNSLKNYDYVWGE